MIEIIELFMRYLARFDFGELKVGVHLLWPLSLFVIYRLFSRSYQKSEIQMLSELNSFNDNKPKVRKTDQYIELSNLTINAFEVGYWRSKFEILESIFNRKLIDVKINSKAGVRVRLFYDSLPVKVDFNLCPPLKPMQSWVGVNQFGENVVVDLQKNSSVYVDGKPGSGKTIILKSLIKAFVEGLKDQVEIVIVTTKSIDYRGFDLPYGSYLKNYDPFDGDFVQNVEKILYEFNEVREIELMIKSDLAQLSRKKITDFNLESLRQQGICATIKRKIFVFDEAKDYLSKEKSDLKEVTKAKQDLISNVYTHMRRSARFLSMPIIVASQTQTESDLDLPLKMFHLRLASSTNEAMSRIIAGDKRLVDPSFTSGKFYLETDKGSHVLRAPFVY